MEYPTPTEWLLAFLQEPFTYVSVLLIIFMCVSDYLIEAYQLKKRTYTDKIQQFNRTRYVGSKK